MKVRGGGITSIRGRGNSTWQYPKKPYTLKLENKQSILNLPAHKRWHFLANYADKTLLRTEAAFKLGEIFNNLAWTPRSEQVILYLNDEYLGVYQLTEAIKIDANRVNISKTISKENPDGGYILEVDLRKGEEFNFTSSKGVVFNCSDPDEALDEVIIGDTRTVFEKIQADLQYVENILYSDNFRDPEQGYRKYIDIDSFIDWYLVQEISKNVDARFAYSVYMYYDPDDAKYHMGPIWDYDYAFGNVNYNDAQYAEGFWVKEAPRWVSRFFEDAYFVSLVKSRWNSKKADIEKLTLHIDERAAFMDKAQQTNFERWPILDQNVGVNPVVAGTYQGEIDYLKSWLALRINWLNAAINSL
jgi:hypothetical protein